MSALSGGSAQWTVTNLTPGAHDLRATYLGKDGDGPSISTATSEVIAQVPTTVSLVGTPTTTAPGKPVTLTATLSSSDGTPSGTVQFFAGPTLLGTGTQTSPGVYNLTTTSLPGGGTSQVTASYFGDPTFAASQSHPVALVVAASTTTPTPIGQVVPASTLTTSTTSTTVTTTMTSGTTTSVGVPTPFDPTATTTLLTSTLLRTHGRGRHQRATVQLQATVVDAYGSFLIGDKVQIGIAGHGRPRTLRLNSGVAGHRVDIPLPSLLTATAVYTGQNGHKSSQSAATSVVPGPQGPVSRLIIRN